MLKVKQLEDENRKLETKLKILKEHEQYGSKIDDIVTHLANELEDQVENLIQDQENLKAELLKKEEEVEDTKKKSVGVRIASPSDVYGAPKVFCLISSF